MTVQLEHAIVEARRIRRVLMARERRCGGSDLDLAGYCGIASALLADARGARWSLCVADLSPQLRHVWNEFRGTIIDITATQFSSFAEVDHEHWRLRDAHDRGVLVTRERRWYHPKPTHRGRAAVQYLIEEFFGRHEVDGFDLTRLL